MRGKFLVALTDCITPIGDYGWSGEGPIDRENISLYTIECCSGIDKLKPVLNSYTRIRDLVIIIG